MAAQPAPPSAPDGPAIAPAQITGVVLAGGRGSRMGGVDKGLQVFSGKPLAQHVMQRLAPQVGSVIVNANRNLDAYRQFGVPVHADELPDYAGPLAGFVTALAACSTPYLVTVPCDSPLFPADLVARLAHALREEDAQIAMASVQETDGDGPARWRAQPVFCLMTRDVLPGLRTFVDAGGRKIDRWTATCRTVQVRFDDPHAFANANTADELRALQA